jgi:hypothetical protein
MAVVCTYSGSYYDPAPWTERACRVEASVPEGCPVHFTISTAVDLATITASRIAPNGTDTPLASTASLVGTHSQEFLLPDEDSCDCALKSSTITFQQIAVTVPAAAVGDVIEIGPYSTEDGLLGIMVTPAAACPPPAWPDYEIELACDPCDLAHPGAEGAGCAAGGKSPVALALFALLPLARRRRATPAAATASGRRRPAW